MVGVAQRSTRRGIRTAAIPAAHPPRVRARGLRPSAVCSSDRSQQRSMVDGTCRGHWREAVRGPQPKVGCTCWRQGKTGVRAAACPRLRGKLAARGGVHPACRAGGAREWVAARTAAQRVVCFERAPRVRREWLDPGTAPIRADHSRRPTGTRTRRISASTAAGAARCSETPRTPRSMRRALAHRPPYLARPDVTWRSPGALRS
jgi:hypothetical protein